VGQFTLAVQAEPRDLELGDTLKLVLAIEGSGNLGHLELPRLDSFSGLHLLGQSEEQRLDTRKVSCEFAVESPRTREVPAIVLDYFDPDARVYRRASTQPIALQVKARAPFGVAGANFKAQPTLYLFYGVAVLVAVAIAAWVARLLRRR
jgi:hypothetical protein